VSVNKSLVTTGGSASTGISQGLAFTNCTSRHRELSPRASRAIGTIEGLPVELAEPVTVEVRGEVLMTTAQFEHANEVRTAHGGQPFANPRDAAAGTLRAKDRAYTVPMTFFGYGLLPLPDTETELASRLAGLAHSDLMAQAATYGVNTTATTAVPAITADTAEQVLAQVQKIARSPASGVEDTARPALSIRERIWL
jgi:NAD-dependent DNA ligase